ncbi:pitrilysin family protein [Arenibacter sp. ARW7G5Y1]|uniref:M16 family metallopeptidase n=1 Tax=Arenibacter sp. ARW7G5Y1 TaxID=2135619 RepID=UPI000D761E9D|nr:insulinase family protein [Arenibacter sp. ARW7G5Y1]PXX29945.1 putative Zn-dependent peptidase [Arenibacter sp. ARW7G5Y1]
MKNQTIKHTISLFLYTIFIWVPIIMYPSVQQDKIGLDPGIRKGELSNGLTYYIKPTGSGSSEMEIRLLIRAGSANQDPDQYELDHFIEHIAFKAGRNMTIAKAHDAGFDIGQINGNTSFDFSNYLIQKVGTDKERRIAFQLLQDIIWDLDLKKEYIDSERSVILNEIVTRGGFDAKSILVGMESAMLGRGAQRPKDYADYIHSFPYEPLLRYYNDWYRPDLMAIVVVGDIRDIGALEKEITDKFSRSKKVRDPRSPNKDYSDYRNSSPQFISKELTYMKEGSKNQAVNLRLYMRQGKDSEEQGLEVLQNEQKRSLLLTMLMDRFKTDNEVYASTYKVFPGYSIPSSLGLFLRIRIEGGLGKEAILKSMRLLRQLKVYGFTAQEFEECKRKYLVALNKKDTTKVAYWMDDILDNFIYGKVLPPNKKSILRNLINDLTLEELNNFVTEGIKTGPREIDILMLAPSGHPVLSYSENTVRGWIAEASKLPVRMYSPPISPTALMPLSIQKGLKTTSILKTAHPIPKTTEYVLGNGVRIVMNPLGPNTQKAAGISLHGFTPKGISCYPKTDYFSALNSVEIVKNSGVGGLNKFDLKRLFSEKGFGGKVMPYINYNEAGITGYLSVEDLEMALKLVYLYFMEPNKNSLAFKDWKLNATSSIAMKKANESDFMGDIKSILGDYTLFPNRENILEGVSKTNLDRAYEIYRDIFGSPTNFTFVFIGDFSEEKVLALSRKYLGNLPIVEQSKKCDSSIAIKQGSLPSPRSIHLSPQEYIKASKVKLVHVSNRNSDNSDWKEDIKIRLLAWMMDFSAKQHLRFNSKEGGLYDISLTSNLDPMRPFNEIFIEFSCHPENMDRLINDTRQVVEHYKNNLVDPGLWERFIKNMMEYSENEIQNNKWISKKIHAFYRYGEPWSSIEDEQKFIKSLSPEDIKNTAQNLLTVKPFQFIMLSDQMGDR